MRVVSKRAIVEFAERYPEALAPLTRWYEIAKRAQWRTFADVKADFPNHTTRRLDSFVDATKGKRLTYRRLIA